MIRYVDYSNEPWKLFGAADFTVVPSVYEPFGMAGVESVLCGTPIVVADNFGVAGESPVLAGYRPMRFA